ncbi:ATP-binding protein [Streptomyces sp. HC307]|uniref:ATP-binding protein n=1 Tax=Streptomyces flavusporus TaxID=3385496 RepID=UPI003916D7F5
MSRPFEESPYAFTVPPRVEAVPAARDRVADRARRLGLELGEELTDDLKLLTGELVANSVTHTKAACVVCIRWTGERLRVEVTDVDPTPVALSQALPVDEHGRGLFLVAALATEWGSQSCVAGKTIWFELEVPSSAEATMTVATAHSEVPTEQAMASCTGNAPPVLAKPLPIVGARARAEYQAA